MVHLVDDLSKAVDQAPEAPAAAAQAPAAAQPDRPTQQDREREWVITIDERLAQVGAEEAARPWSRLSVYRVPRGLLDGNESSYTPQVVSIGPLHSGSGRLQEMERHKWRALCRVLQRTRHKVTVYLEAVRAAEDDVRACYEGHAAGMSSNDLALCMVLDGTFVLEMLRGAQDGGKGFVEKLGYSSHDPVFAMRGTMHAVRSDMVLLENQMPLFVLDILHGLQTGNPGQTGRVAGLAVQFLQRLIPTAERESSAGEKAAATAASFDPLSRPVLHCLDAFRRSLLGDTPQPAPRPPSSHRQLGPGSTKRCRQQLVHCASELREAGIRCRRHDVDSFRDIRFERGVLHIPRILIDDGTESLFLNLIAFEQCHVHAANDFTKYAVFMNNLINSADDVKYLHDRGIIEHWLGSDGEVAELFNRLVPAAFDGRGSYLCDLSDQVNRYYSNRWSTWVANLRHNYCGNPWMVASVVAAALLLLLTTAQTFYSVYSYYWPNH